MIFQHRNPFEPYAESVTRVNVRVDAAVFKNAAVDHTRAQNFYPARPFAKFTPLAAALETRNVHFYARLGEREIRRAQSSFDIGIENLSQNLFERTFQVA